MGKLIKKSIFVLLMSVSVNVFAADTYQVCFTPGDNCAGLIVKTINQAKKSIYVQAYSFTSAPIADALTSAKRRGVDVNVVLDKSQVKDERYSSARYLINQHIPVWVDYKPAIAHNKVMIIDHETVITGSFNFTKSAQYKNAENVLIINNEGLAEKYYANWVRRQELSSLVK